MSNIIEVERHIRVPTEYVLATITGKTPVRSTVKSVSGYEQVSLGKITFCGAVGIGAEYTKGFIIEEGSGELKKMLE